MENKEDETKLKIVIAIIIIISVIAAIVGYCIEGKNSKKSASTISNSTTKSSYENKNNKNTSIHDENSYIVTTDYDGAYKFSLKDGTHMANGVIVFDNGNCKAKYKTINTENNYTWTESPYGYCGINEDKSFYFTLNNKKYTYKCTKDNGKIYGELKSYYNIIGNTETKILDLVYINNNTDIDSVYNELETEWEKEEEDDYKSSCKSLTFKELARNPDNVKNTKVKITGEVIQVMEGTTYNAIRLNITKSSYGYYSDTVYIKYIPKVGEDKVLENDIITIWGTAQGDCTYTTVLKSEVTLPLIEAKYININSK